MWLENPHGDKLGPRVPGRQLLYILSMLGVALTPESNAPPRMTDGLWGELWETAFCQVGFKSRWKW